MTWEDELFAFLDDLEGQAEAAYALDREADLADRERAEYQQVTLAARLMASVGEEIRLEVLGVGALAGMLDRVATGWLLVSGNGADWVVRQAAISAVRGASDRAVPEVAWPAVARLGLGSALRQLADSGERCVLHATDGTRQEGVLRRVGGDFVEMVAGEPAQVALVPFRTIAALQSRP